MYQENQISSAGERLGLDSTLNLSASANSGSSSGNVSHMPYQNSVISTNMHRDIETLSVSSIMSDASTSNTEITSMSSVESVSALGQYVPVLSERQLDRLHNRDKAVIKRYAEEGRRNGCLDTTWKGKYLPRLVVVCEHLRKSLNKAVIDFPHANDAELKKQMATMPHDLRNDYAFRSEIGNEIGYFFAWYNKNRHTFEPSATSSVGPLTTSNASAVANHASDIPGDFSTSMHSDSEAFSVSSIMSDASASNTEIISMSSVESVSALGKYVPVLSERQLGRLHNRDKAVIKRYAEEGRREGCSDTTWKQKYLLRLVDVCEHLRNSLNKAVTDFPHANDAELKKQMATVPHDWFNGNAFRREIGNEIGYFFAWYNKNRHTFEPSATSSVGPLTTSNASAVENHASNIPDELQWILAARDEISNRTGIPADYIQGVSFKSRVNGFPFFISNKTVHHNSVTELDSFLRHAEPGKYNDGSGMSWFYADGTAYSALYKVDSGTGHIKNLDLMAEKLDAGNAHPDTTTLWELTWSLRNRHSPDWLNDALINIQERTGIEASAIGYVHYLAQDKQPPLFMTNDTASKLNCDPEVLDDFFCYVQPKLDGDRGSARYIQDGETHSVDLQFNPKTYEITDFRLSKSMYLDLSEE